MPNAKTLRPKLYHLYREDEVAEDLNSKGAKPTDPLPQLVQDAYTLLGADWRAAARAWRESGHASPPVMLTVCNRTETAARIEHYFTQGDAYWPELKAPGPDAARGFQGCWTRPRSARPRHRTRTTRPASGHRRGRRPIARDGSELLARKKEEILREIVDNVGKRGTAGQRLQSVISVAMLSEGWDAKNVTHIMGLRAFTSQLLCEQVIGRGLRRVGAQQPGDPLAERAASRSGGEARRSRWTGTR
ncbi:MAG: hypothetical protein IPO66_22140 [Rhodanobacteraceae bacterium]|nr:hypothetical protein [Rhodanobacteraceae bacterium]